MSTKPAVDIVRFLEDRRFGWWHAKIMLLCFLMLLVEGMDYNALAVAAPSLIRGWQVSKSEIGIAFAVSNLAVLVGTLAFSALGDRFGRRLGIIVGVLLYSVPSLCTAFASSVGELYLLRFIAGLGMGGVMPNAIALLTEIAPKGLKSRIVMIPFIGIGLGVAAIGGVAAAFIPKFGWPAVFLIPGVSGLIVCVALVLWLPESIRYLTVAKPDSPQLDKALRALDPSLDASSVASGPGNHAPAARPGLGILLRRENGLMNLLLWLCFAFEYLTFIILASWLPLILETAGLSPTEASLTFAYVGLANLGTQLLIAMFLDRYHFGAMLVATLVTMACFIGFGMPGLDKTSLMAITVLLVAASGATHSALNGLVGNVYPTNIRATAVGIASGFGRAAFIGGPVLGGYLLAQALPFQTLTLLIMGPYLPVALICLLLARLYTGKVAEARALDREASA
ncbi:MFS transporter [Sphingomonas sp. AOB5]|uniref:MFS transporter n=1 Tax=Sphingomonas sp. AOB5 TaxID=3034017 RepID=UPI0023F6FF07|nr:MFS transporter [Sphingomonas sp. AOB5]MDF7775612.1 MFS transporter [Sphingomonas sp. AOB5]